MFSGVLFCFFWGGGEGGGGRRGVIGVNCHKVSLITLNSAKMASAVPQKIMQRFPTSLHDRFVEL